MATDPTLDLESFAATLSGLAPLIGLDVGTKTIGVALSDRTRTVATALETVRRKKFRDDAARLLEIISAEHIAGIVIGLPINLDGSEGPRSQSTRAFARNLAAITDIPLFYWDERWSTAAVERTLIAADASRRRREEVIDKLAATYILQGALDRLANLASKKQ